MDNVALKVGEVTFERWTKCEITRSLECGSGSFDITGAVLPQGLRDKPVQVSINGEPVLTGWADSAETEYSETSRGAEVKGRDAVADLIDCSPVIREFKGLGIVAIAKEICKPFGIRVTAPNTRAVYGAPFAQVAGSPGETPFDFLDRLARAVGVQLWSDGLGGLVVGIPSFRALPVVLERGVNLRSIRVLEEYYHLFSEIRVIAQTSGSDYNTTSATTSPVARLKETRVKRYRPLTVLAEQAADVAMLTERAKTEKAMRWGRGLRVEATVTGWRVKSGLPVWPIGVSVKVRDADLGLFDERLVILDATYTLDEEGAATKLTLVKRSSLDRPLTPVKDIDE